MTKRKTAIELIKRIRKEVEYAVVSRDQMLSDLKMMNIKIRQLSGDASLMDNKNSNIVENLWRMGKIDEIMSSEFYKMDEKEKGLFLKYLAFIQEEFHKRFSKPLDKLTPEERRDLVSIELEILRVDSSFMKKKAN